MNLYYTPGSLANISGYVQWASWLLDLRTNMDVNYAGTTSNTAPGAGEILLRPATVAEWSGMGYSTTSPNAATNNGAAAGSKVIYLNPHIAPSVPAYEDLISHELGHALGYFRLSGGTHSTDPDDLMYPSVNANTFPMTTADIGGFSLGPAFPATDIADKTSAIRDSNGDIWIHDINGKQVHLDFIEGSPANAPHFLIASNVVNEETIGLYNTAFGAVTLPVHSMGPDYMTTLTVVGSEVHVTNAYLI